jgi:uncharacterized protein GlcG (DUF336 family)
VGTGPDSRERARPSDQPPPVHLILLHRLDDTQVASVNVGIGKARTAAIYRRRSKEVENQIKAG